MDLTKIDYTLYLVTDSTPAILGDRDIVTVVEAALEGGVSIVQYRDKTSDTGLLISTAKKLHAITRKHNVPLLINDRVDVALAVGCEGVHIGQDDMDLPTARRLLGPKAIIGVTASSTSEALTACKDGANYLGIGTMFATPTKTNTKDIIGTSGTQSILEAMSQHSYSKNIPTVSIGGINSTNIQRVLFQSSSPSKSLSGIAIVSAIMGSPDPKTSASTLLSLIKNPPPFALTHSSIKTDDIPHLLNLIPNIIKEISTQNPLSHNITNTVAQHISANICLALGGSPIMSSSGLEASDLAKLNGALLLNTGTVTPESVQNYIMALQAYNAVGGPVVYDPVGAGATRIRREAVRTMLASGYFDVIKGNEGEIATVYNITNNPFADENSRGDSVQQKGVDSSSTLSHSQKATLVYNLARLTKSVILLTGETDYLSDGQRTYSISNGHDLLTQNTGTGCVLGTMITCTLAVEREDKLLAVLAACLVFEIAAEQAAEYWERGVEGPASFWTRLVDQIWKIRSQSSWPVEKGPEGFQPGGWLGRARVVDVSGEIEV